VCPERLAICAADRAAVAVRRRWICGFVVDGTFQELDAVPVTERDAVQVDSRGTTVGGTRPFAAPHARLPGYNQL